MPKSEGGVTGGIFLGILPQIVSSLSGSLHEANVTSWGISREVPPCKNCFSSKRFLTPALANFQKLANARIQQQKERSVSHTRKPPAHVLSFVTVLRVCDCNSSMLGARDPQTAALQWNLLIWSLSGEVQYQLSKGEF